MAWVLVRVEKTWTSGWARAFDRSLELELELVLLVLFWLFWLPVVLKRTRALVLLL